MPTFVRDNINFNYVQNGTGIPFVFQHGLGGDIESILALLGLIPGAGLFTMDFRAHGKTFPLGDLQKVGFDAFADDLMALMDHLGIASAVVGGTSMGAGVALNFALRYPARITGLILLRPAWLDAPNPENVKVFALMAKLIREQKPQAGQQLFEQSPIYAAIAAESTDSASSLLAQFAHPRALETVAKFERIPNDVPNRDRREWSKITVPTLVLANRSDPIHPFEYGKTIAQEIPDAEFKELTPKALDLAGYTQEVRTYITQFLHSHWVAK